MNKLLVYQSFVVLYFFFYKMFLLNGLFSKQHFFYDVHIALSKLKPKQKILCFIQFNSNFFMKKLSKS